jgi:1-acyl-sn-glycerol-3-phosphate acyltransferase
MLQFDLQPLVPLPDGPIILAANHPSMIDPAIITTLTPAQVSILIPISPDPNHFR